jgi:hypothetical protein
VGEMTVKDILTKNSKSAANTLCIASNGVHLDTEYNKRKVKLTRTDSGYIVTFTNPNAVWLSKKAIEAIDIIKRELGVGQV